MISPSLVSILYEKIHEVYFRPIPRVERNLPDDKDGHRSILNQNGIDPNMQMTPLNIVKKHSSSKQRIGIISPEAATSQGQRPNPLGPAARVPSSPGAQRPIKTNFVQAPVTTTVPGQVPVQQPVQQQQIAISNIPNQNPNIRTTIRNPPAENIMTIGNQNIITRKRPAEGQKPVAPVKKAVYYTTTQGVRPIPYTTAQTIDGKNMEIRKISGNPQGHR